MDDERLVTETVIDAAPDVVWSWLRDPALIQRWFGWDADGLDEEIQQIFLQQAAADDGARTLTWSDGEELVVAPAEGGGTVVRLRRQGHEGPGTWDGVYDEVDEGWITFVHQLSFALTHHPEAERRTLSAHGLDLGPPGDPLLTRLGLRPLGNQPAGAGYTLLFSDGSTFAGEVFFQTDLQLGLTVADEGDALLVVARTPPETAPPNGRATFILSLFGEGGVDDDRFAAAEERWTEWWSSPGAPEDAEAADADRAEGAEPGADAGAADDAAQGDADQTDDTGQGDAGQADDTGQGDAGQADDTGQADDADATHGAPA